ncbi:hypothetical protein GCM10009765_29990 [Fodinicola feengrottensis]|uniref:DUF998 domain-containing protein n=1 Tax=Fodinicola feengrottensis TaxID=435914 RepID=A0ABN2GY35_9ACTN
MAVTSDFNDSYALSKAAQQSESAVRAPVSPAFPVLAGVAALLLAVLSVGYLHMVAPAALSPIRDTVSDYVYLHGAGGLFNFSAVMTAFGSVGLMVGLRYSRLRVSKLTYALMGLWCAGLVLLPTFPTDRLLADLTVTGAVHRYLSLIAFISLPLAGLGVASALASKEKLRPLAQRLRVMCAAGSMSVLALLLTHLPDLYPQKFGNLMISGLVERVLLVVDFGLLATIAIGILATGRAAVSTVDGGLK